MDIAEGGVEVVDGWMDWVGLFKPNDRHFSKAMAGFLFDSTPRDGMGITK